MTTIENQTTSNLPVDTQALLRAQAEAMQKRIAAPSGDTLKLQTDKTFRLPGGAVAKGPLRLVCLDYVSYNAFYDRPWSEGDKTPPACYAIGPEVNDALVPSEKSPDRQDDACKPCPNNMWGSKGNGKACGNHALLALVEPSDNPDSPVMICRLMPTAVKHWHAFVSTVLANPKFQLGLASASFEMYFAEGEKYASARFGMPLANDDVGVHAMRIEAARKRLMVEPNVSGWAPLKQPERKKKA